MKFKDSILGWFALIIICFSVIMIVSMFIIPTYPTYLHFIYIAFGLLILFIDYLIRKSNRLSKHYTRLIQIILILIISYSSIKILFPPRGHFIVKFKEGFVGPFMIIFDAKGYPPLTTIENKNIVEIPMSGVYYTSTSSSESYSMLHFVFPAETEESLMVYSSSTGSWDSSENNEVNGPIEYYFGNVVKNNDTENKENEIKLFQDSVLKNYSKKQLIIK